jgi:hypothetical protein
MLNALAWLTLFLSAADHWTTYLCLRSPIAGWDVVEANPLAAWLFQSTGLVPGLLLDSAVTLSAVVFLLFTDRLPSAAKAFCFLLIAAFTGYAVANNLAALQVLGLSPLGAA